MKPYLRIFAVVAGLVTLAACETGTLTGPEQAGVRAPELGADRSAAHAVDVLNWNIYIGTNVDAVIGALANADPNDDLPALLDAIATLEATDFPARAEAIAHRIARERPHVVGLQEVTTIDIDLTAAGLPIDIDLDFLTILQAKLGDHGQNYVVAGQVTNTDANVPLPIPGTTIRVIDHDVVLVDPTRVNVTGSIGANFTNNLGAVAPGVSLVRGYVAITAMIDGAPYAFGNTHLEPDLAGVDLSGLRAAQAAELVAVVDALAAGAPAILMGDFNDIVSSPMYGVVTGAGYADVWAALRGHAPGLTCCHLSDLSNRLPTFDERIDYVFARGLGDRIRGRVERLGEVPADRLPGPFYPIWPSDHAGLVADFVVPPPHMMVAAP